MQADIASPAALRGATNQTFLRGVLVLDAIGSGGSALLVLMAADRLSPHLGLSVALLRWAGIMLIPFVALLLVTASRESLSFRLVRAVIAFNGFWVVASAAALVVSNGLLPGLGVAVVVVQAAAVALLGGLQYAGMKRSA